MFLSLQLVAFATTGCHSCHPAEPSVHPGLVAVLEHPDGLHVIRRVGDDWHQEKLLPISARALRFSPNGSAVAWVQDENEGRGFVPRGYVQGWKDASPRPLGTLGLRKRQAMGLAVANNGRVVFLNEAGDLVEAGAGRRIARGTEVILGDRGELVYVDDKGCLVDDAGLFQSHCDNETRPLELTAGLLLARDNELLLQIAETTRADRYTGILDAHSWHRGHRILLLRRSNDGPVPLDVVTVLRPQLIPREVAHAPIIVSARFDGDGGILIVRVPLRKDVYQQILAHAPDEFGGEILWGEAVRITPERFEEKSIPGLETEHVRALFYAR
jgi:hypothetical protein